MNWLVLLTLGLFIDRYLYIYIYIYNIFEILFLLFFFFFFLNWFCVFFLWVLDAVEKGYIEAKIDELSGVNIRYIYIYIYIYIVGVGCC